MVEINFEMESNQFNFGVSNKVRRDDLVYKLIIEQLCNDNYQSTANIILSSGIVPDPPCSGSNRLLHLLALGLKYEAEHPEKYKKHDPSETGIDLEYQADVEPTGPEPDLYVTTYVTSHKGPCRASAFSKDGELIATGSVDASIKILDVERMVAKAGEESSSQYGDNYATHPVIRTLYDHVSEVTCLQFHPKESILFSGSTDTTIKLFDFSKSSAKRSYKVIEDSHPITCMSLHPNGDFLLVGTTHFVIRMYDVNTTQCYVGSFPEHHHTDEITCVNYQQIGKQFVTSSKDGQIKLWDGTTNKCVNTFPRAHDGAEVCSVEFSKNGKYVLSSGKDSMVKLWELSASRCLIEYSGAGATGAKEHNGQAVFNHTEDFILFADELTTSLCSWNSRNSARKSLLPLGHNGLVRYLVHSAVSPAFVTCSDDNRARFWQYRPF